MSISLTNDTKTDITVTNVAKPTGGAFGDFPGRTFADGGTFGQPGTFISKDAKNSITITPTAKT